MKLRHPWLIKSAGFTIACFVRCWMGTLRYRFHSFGPEVRPLEASTQGRYIYAFWHEYLAQPIFHYGGANVLALISQHADGQILAEVCRHLGLQVTRGSTTRGGVEAIRSILRGRDAHLGITPDGPRGPRRRLQPGLVYLSARTGMPIVPIGFAFRKSWRLKSWDRFAIPRPWTVATTICGAPISIPPGVDREAIEGYRQAVENAILWATDLAEHWALEKPEWLQSQTAAGLKYSSSSGANTPGQGEWRTGEIRVN